MTKKREFFSRKNDGTSFFEDVANYLQEVKEDWAAGKVEALLERIQHLNEIYQGQGDRVLEIGDKIMQALNSEGADAIANFIKEAIQGDADDKFIDWVRNEGVNTMLDLWYGAGRVLDSVESQLEKWVLDLQGKSKAYQEAAVAKNMSLLLQAYSEHESTELGKPALSRRAADLYVQMGVNIAGEAV
jgi:hypothetical protein